MKDLSLHILDIVQNSIRANAKIIRVDLTIADDKILRLMIADDGCGMEADQLGQVKNPFFTTRQTRRIGLGVPLLTQKAQQSGGGLTIHSTPGEGTALEAQFCTRHPDCPPTGDLPECAWMLMAANPEMNMVFRLRSSTGEWEWDSVKIREALNGMHLTDSWCRKRIMEWFNEDFSIFKEVLIEM